MCVRVSSNWNASYLFYFYIITRLWNYRYLYKSLHFPSLVKSSMYMSYIDHIFTTFLCVNYDHLRSVELLIVSTSWNLINTICDLVRGGCRNMLVQCISIQRSPLSRLHRQQLQLSPPKRRQPRRCCLGRDAKRSSQFAHDVSHRWPPSRVGVDALLDHLADGLQLVILVFL